MNNTTYVERINRKLRQHSCATNIDVATTEWSYTRNCKDLGEAVGQCELCGHTPLRILFEILNELNGETLLVGSRCIRRFDLSDGEYTDSDQRGLIREAEKQSATSSLVELAQHDEDFEIDSFLEYFLDRGAFTPKQLSTLIWRLEIHGIDYDPHALRMKIRRSREKEQLLSMEPWQIEKLLRCMSPDQKRWLQRQRETV